MTGPGEWVRRGHQHLGGWWRGPGVWPVCALCPQKFHPYPVCLPSPQDPWLLGFTLPHAGFCPLVPTDQDPLSACLPRLCLLEHSACDCPDAFPLSPPGPSRCSRGRPSIPEVGFSIFLPCAPLSTQVDMVVYLFYLPLYRPSPPFWPMEHSRWSHLLVTQACATLPQSPRGIGLSSEDFLM